MNEQVVWSDYQGEESGGMQLRREVFIDEQGFSYDHDELDGQALHLTLYDEAHTPVAVARLLLNCPAPQVATFGRIAVKQTMRGRGLGRRLLCELEARAKQLGMRSAHLGAQRQAQPFYELCGFTVSGEEYDEESCPHVPMDKRL